MNSQNVLNIDQNKNANKRITGGGEEKPFNTQDFAVQRTEWSIMPTVETQREVEREREKKLL